MSILEAIRETLDMLNHIEIKGEYNIAAMSRAMSNLKGISNILEQMEGVSNNEDDNKQGKDV